ELLHSSTESDLYRGGTKCGFVKCTRTTVSGASTQSDLYRGGIKCGSVKCTEFSDF
ncbi:unnamed protein product, partial [Urochloa humidicola]